MTRHLILSTRLHSGLTVTLSSGVRRADRRGRKSIWYYYYEAPYFTGSTRACKAATATVTGAVLLPFVVVVAIEVGRGRRGGGGVGARRLARPGVAHPSKAGANRTDRMATAAGYKYKSKRLYGRIVFRVAVKVR